MKEEGLREKVLQAAQKWDLWGYGSFGLPRLELEGDRYLLVENLDGIVEYGASCIRLAAGSLQVSVRGEGLEIASMDRGSLAIRGRIREVTMTEAGR
ncbi:MAG: YabP/YqfC family sporulation protein [Clostridia bacterium]|nr:YabP/YqfC family sporulation protein [Clostridia bacterium]